MFSSAAARWRQQQAVEQPDHSGRAGQHDQQQRKIEIHH